jgi:peptidoglycan/LPS O-acetylase OafA/YrhL
LSQLSSTTILEAAAPNGPAVMVEGGKPRLEFLDALRGIAALAVLLQHSAEILWPGYLTFSEEVIRPGEWGVFVFFMISGFVIPLSLKNESNAIGFWIGRVFRLFPLYWVVIVAAYVLARLGYFPTSTDFDSDSVQNFVVNLTMVQEFLATPQLVGAAWSLAYEVTFYLFMTLMLLGRLTRSATKATIICLAASASLGLLVDPAIILNAESIYRSGLIVLAVSAAGLTALWGRLDGPVDRVLAVFVTLAMVSLILDQPRDMWFSLLLFATMGCGWVYNEANSGRIGLRVASALSAVTILVSAVQFQFWANPSTRWADVLTLVAAHGAFALAYGMRRMRMPKVLTWLGAISYSVYLIHALVIHIMPAVSGHRVIAMACWVAVTLAIAHLTHRLIELPAQRLGRVLRANSRFAKGSQPVPQPM